MPARLQPPLLYWFHWQMNVTKRVCALDRFVASPPPSMLTRMWNRLDKHADKIILEIGRTSGVTESFADVLWKQKTNYVRRLCFSRFPFVKRYIVSSGQETLEEDKAMIWEEHTLSVRIMFVQVELVSSFQHACILVEEIPSPRKSMVA